MSLNKFMHPRNKYRKPPDFKTLAIKYPEFRKYAKQDISGKVSLNFKDLEAVRALTCTLLKEDFGLDVNIPLDRLIPTLPLRLNYLLWIEDLLEINKRTSEIKGIDIGCGASCVYPLLAAKKFSWKMLATEVDMESAFIASNNVKKNNLQDMIRVRAVNEGQMLAGLLDSDIVYDFCMCNPPFFSSTEELDSKNVSRSPNRPPPRNAHSGSATELVVEGGETAFVSGIIQDSVKLKGVVRIYSVMVGHKSSVKKVQEMLQEAGVAAASSTTTEFCQGHTTRWGVAWTLDSSVSLPKESGGLQSKKKNTPFCHTFKADLLATVERLQKLMEELQITFTNLKSNQEIIAMEITAMENTWGNSRKKRRLEKLKQRMAEKNENSQGDGLEGHPKETFEVEKNNEIGSVDATTETENNEKTNTTNVNKEVVNGSHPKLNSGNESVMENKGKRTFSDSEVGGDSSSSSTVKKPKTEITPSDSNSGKKVRKEPILHGSLVVKGGSEESAVELTWMRGSGGKDAAHQVLQHFINNFKPH